MNVTPSILVGVDPQRERRELLLHELVARDLDAALGHLDRPGDVETIVRDGDAAEVLASAATSVGLLVCGAGAQGVEAICSAPRRGASSTRLPVPS